MYRPLLTAFGFLPVPGLEKGQVPRLTIPIHGYGGNDGGAKGYDAANNE